MVKNKKKTGRPPIAESKRRNIYISFTCTVSEAHNIKRKADKLNTTQSNFIRQAVNLFPYNKDI